MAVYFLGSVYRTRSAPKMSQGMLIGIGVLVILLLFPVMGVLRTLKGELHMSATAMSTDAIMMASQTGLSSDDMIQTYFGTGSNVAGFEESLYHLITDKKPEWGSSYLYYYVFLPIPRIIWPGKGSPLEWALWLWGIDWDPKVATIGMTEGAIGMAFQQWGWVGIPAEFLFTGWFFGWIEVRLRRRPEAAHLQLAYAGFYAALPQIGRNTLLTLIARKWLFNYGIPVFILWRIYKAHLVPVRRANPPDMAPQALQTVPVSPTG